MNYSKSAEARRKVAEISGISVEEIIRSAEETIPIKTIEYFLKQWKKELNKRDYKNKCSEYMEKTLRIFYTVSYLEHYIELLKEAGRGR